MSSLPEEIVRLFARHGVPYQHLRHPVCKTSAESAAAREAAGGGRVPGAKALLLRVGLRGGAREFHLLVMSGTDPLCNRAVRTAFPNWQRYRFATPAEMGAVLRGVEPGAVPPLGPPIFPLVTGLHYDRSLVERGGQVGFNIADHRQSLVVDISDLVRVARPTLIVSLTDNLSISQPSTSLLHSLAGSPTVSFEVGRQ